MSTELGGRARLLALYDGKAAEAEKRTAQLRELLSTSLMTESVRSVSYQIARQTNVLEENRERAGRLREAGSPVLNENAPPA